MSLQQFIAFKQIIPQSDFEASLGDNGQWTGTQSFKIQKGLFDDPSVRTNFFLGKPITEIDTNNDAIWSFLRVQRVSVVTEIGGWTIIRAHIQGFDSTSGGAPGDQPDDAVFTSYSMRGETSDAPYNEHPKFKALSVNERASLGNLASGYYVWAIDPFDDGDTEYRLFYANPPVNEDGESVTASVPTQSQITSSDGKEFAHRIAEGGTSYRRGGFTWSKRWSSTTSLTSAHLNSLGKIANPPGNPPKPGTGRDYLLISAGFEMVGSDGASPTFTNELIFELSDEGGHDEFLQS